MVKFGNDNKLNLVIDRGSEKLSTYFDLWNVDASADDIQSKFQELYEAIVYFYAAVIPPGKTPRFDFFLMHSLTSSLSIHVPLQHLSPVQQALLLKAYFIVTLSNYVARGRPELFLEDFRNYKTTMIETPNRWIDLIRFAIATRDTHALKVVRALMQAESLYGDRGGIFLRAAELTHDAVAHADSLYDGKAWIFDGVGWPQAWETAEETVVHGKKQPLVWPVSSAPAALQGR